VLAGARGLGHHRFRGVGQGEEDTDPGQFSADRLGVPPC
jgi:hypothetical protein